MTIEELNEIEMVNLDFACTQLFVNCSESVKALIINFEYGGMTSSELQLGPQLGQKSQRYFKKVCLYPAIELKLLAQTYPENPRHPRQKYYLTKLGKAFQQYLIKNQK